MSKKCIHRVQITGLDESRHNFMFRSCMTQKDVDEIKNIMLRVVQTLKLGLKCQEEDIDFIKKSHISIRSKFEKLGILSRIEQSEQYIDSENGWTYFIQSKKDSDIKIGYTQKKPISRLKALQTGNPETLKIVGLIEGNVEKYLHKKFYGLRLNGEWFKCRKSLIRYIQNNSIIGYTL